MATSNTNLDAQRNLAVALRRLQSLERSKCFAPYDLKSRATEQQEGILRDINTTRHRYVLGGNQSGKSQLGGRECSWVFTETHPFWKRPEDWGDEPLTMMVVARTTTQYQELWETKIRPFLSPDEYKEYNAGNVLQKVVNPKNGNKILFFSHHSPDDAREKVQSFVAHWVWLDEMPRSFRLLEELHRRCQSKRSPFIATFTPKAIQKDIRQYIEAESQIHKKYKLHTLANPIYSSPLRRAELMEEHAGYSDEMRNTVLFGDWYGGELAVYDFNPERDLRNPEEYHPGWRHVEIIDPAASGKAGLMLLAESPMSGTWFVVKAEYVSGAAPTDLIHEVERITNGYNIVRRICDPHEAWFMKEAAKGGRTYTGVFKKNERKKELIKNLQEKLSSRRLAVAPWCELVIDEFNTCQWSETTRDKIVGASRFHLLDCAQYGADNLPKAEKVFSAQTFDQALKQANRARKEKAAAAAQGKTTQKPRLIARRGKVWRR